MTYVELKDGSIKKIDIDIRTASKILTLEGFERCIESKVLHRSDFKPAFLEGREV